MACIARSVALILVLSDVSINRLILLDGRSSLRDLGFSVRTEKKERNFNVDCGLGRRDQRILFR